MNTDLHMLDIDTNNKQISFIYNRIVRVFSFFKEGASNGTGFFIKENGLLLTCCHVISGRLLRDLRVSEDFKNTLGNTEGEKIDNYIRSKIQKIEVVLADGTQEKVILKSFDYVHDIALLKTTKSSGKKPFFEFELENKLDYLDEILFCGFSEAPYYDNFHSPFAVNTGLVSAFPELIIGGEKYKHVQLNSINLGGNSGAPLFTKDSNKVCGIINGNYIRHHEKLAVYDDNEKITKGRFEVPLSIAYATEVRVLKDNSDIFKRLIMCKD